MDSPVCVRRRIHFRSLSDVTPARRAQPPRARSHSERPGDAPSPPAVPAAPASPARPAPHLSPPPTPRRAHSERSSPDASLASIERARLRCDEALTILGNPWRKMSDADLRDAPERTDPLRPSLDKVHADDPWIRGKGTYPKAPETKKVGNFNVFRGVSQNAEAARPVGDSEPKRGKLERKSPVVCDSCGNESCECWRPRSPRCPRTPRQQRALSSPNAGFEVSRKVSGGGGEAGAGLLCTCEGAARSPRPGRPSPLRLAPRPPAPARSQSAEERPHPHPPPPPPPPPDGPRAVCSDDVHGDINKPADPLLETTC